MAHERLGYCAGKARNCHAKAPSGWCKRRGDDLWARRGRKPLKLTLTGDWVGGGGPGDDGRKNARVILEGRGTLVIKPQSIAQDGWK